MVSRLERQLQLLREEVAERDPRHAAAQKVQRCFRRFLYGRRFRAIVRAVMQRWAARMHIRTCSCCFPVSLARTCSLCGIRFVLIFASLAFL